MIHRGIIGLAGLLLLLGVAIGGYALGAAAAPDSEEAAVAEDAAYEEAYTTARQDAHQASRARGIEEGQREGQDAGRQSGKRRGAADGGAGAEAQLAAAAEAEAAATREAAVAEAQERAANCGAPLFVEGYCPTDEEIELESQAESLCGPGTAEGREEGAALGIQC